MPKNIWHNNRVRVSMPMPIHWNWCWAVGFLQFLLLLLLLSLLIFFPNNSILHHCIIANIIYTLQNPAKEKAFNRSITRLLHVYVYNIYIIPSVYIEMSIIYSGIRGIWVDEFRISFDEIDDVDVVVVLTQICDVNNVFEIDTSEFISLSLLSTLFYLFIFFRTVHCTASWKI